jgi:inorganic triphosphatase YgiF
MIWNLRLPPGDRLDLPSPAKVEMALDQGEVVARSKKGHLQDSILEVELELQEGEPEVLFAIADLLGEEIHLAPSDISKAMRGYRLLNGR